MKSDNLPDLDDLLDGVEKADIQDLSSLQSGNETSSDGRTDSADETENRETEPAAQSNVDDAIWNRFMENLETGTPSGIKDERLIVKLDRDLADSLDECNFSNKCRSDVANAIIRSFFELYLSRLANFRREKRSMFLRLFNN